MWWLIDAREHLRSVEQNLHKFYSLTNALGNYKESDIDKFFEQYSDNIYNTGIVMKNRLTTYNIQDASISDNILKITVIFDISELLNRIGYYRFTYKLDDNMVVGITRRGSFIHIEDLKFICNSYATFKPYVFGYSNNIQYGQKCAPLSGRYHYVKKAEISKVELISNQNFIVKGNEVMAELIIYKYTKFRFSRVLPINILMADTRIYAQTCLPHIPTNKIFDIKQLTQLTVSMEQDEYLNLITELINITNNNPKLQFIKCRYRRRNIECQFRDDRFNYVFITSVDFYKRLK